MSVLSAIKNACLVIGEDVPDQVFASTDRDMQELGRLANEIADRIVETWDWQSLTKICTITGNGSAEAFDIPSDFKRMLRKASLWSSRWQWRFNHVNSLDDWLQFQTLPYNLVSGNWMIYGDQFHLLPLMGSTEIVRFGYLSNAYAKPSTGDRKNGFDIDTDTFVLSEKLLELGIIWQWRANKGLPYAEDMQNYEKKLSILMDTDRGSKGVVRSARENYRGSKTFPGNVGGPTFQGEAIPDGFEIVIAQNSNIVTGQD